MRLIRSGVMATAVAALMCSASCRHDSYNAPAGVHQVCRLDRALMELSSDSEKSIPDSLDRPIAFLSGILSPDGSTDSVIAAFASSAGFTAFIPPVSERFQNLDSLEKILGIVDVNLRKDLPEVNLGDLYGIIFPYNQSILQSDSIVLVALNHYLGSDFEGYGYFEPYQRVNKTPQQLPFDLVEARIAVMYPERSGNGDDRLSVLNDILYHGAMTEAKLRLIPEATEAAALGYDADQMQWAIDNEANIWNAMITRKLLYSTSGLDIERLTSPAPHTLAIHPDAPGRIGRYIGHRIVTSYLKSHPETPLSYLLSPDFYNSSTTLIDAGYAPR